MKFKALLQIALIITIIITLFSFSTGNTIANVAPENHIFLEEGSKAPNFVTMDVLGNKVKLNKILKKSNVLITFLRPVWCPVCNARTHELIEEYKKMQEKGIEIIAVYPSSEEKLRGYVKDLKIPFTVVSDPEEVLFKLYGVERSAVKYQRTMKEKKALDMMKKGQELFHENGNDYGGGIKVAAPIIPADFIINQSKIIKTAHYGDFLGDHILVTNIEKDLKQSFNLRDKVRF
jgi:peroxiredoxin